MAATLQQHIERMHQGTLCAVDELRRAPVGDTLEETRAADEALLAFESALYVRTNVGEIRGLFPHLLACSDALRVHILERTMRALAQGRGIEEALCWLCASGLVQGETRRMLARRTANLQLETETIRAGLRAQEALAWERQRLMLEAALRGGHHARADVLLWGSLARSPVMGRDGSAIDRLRDTLLRLGTVTMRQALDTQLVQRP